MAVSLPPKSTRSRPLVRARIRFFHNGTLPDDDIRPSILNSWQRCHRSGLKHVENSVIDPISRAQLGEARDRNARLLSQASSIMEHVFEQIRSSGSMVILADTEGLILHSLGDPDFVDRAGQVALLPGASWREHERGTNAIGTALTELQAIEVTGPEHYLERNGFLTCSAVPVLDAHNRLAGVLDISSDYRNYHRHTLGLIKLAAQMLEKKLFMTEFARELIITFHPQPDYLHSPQEALIAVDADGRILGVNRPARVFCEAFNSHKPPVTFGDLFKCGFGSFLDRVQSRRNTTTDCIIKLDLRCGGSVYARVDGSVQSTVNGRDRTARPIKPVTPPRPCDRSGGTITLDCLDTGDPRQHLALQRAHRIKGKDIPLIIQGESGVGKELFARAFHNSGPRAAGPFVALNCAAIPENLIESELFGYVGGAFTGARREGAKGKIQQACGGTLFLDEIGDMPLLMQTRLLRVLQERSVTPVGSLKSIPVDISLVCATHRVLRDAVSDGEFREDLYYRVNGLTITLPPLRERTDIRRLVGNILAAEAFASRTAEVTISEEVLRFFEQYPWPGNIRQLHNVIRLSVALLDDYETEVRSTHLPEELVLDESTHVAEPAAPPSLQSEPALVAHAGTARRLHDIELEAIQEVLRETGGNLSAAARQLGVSRNTLYRKLGRM